MKIRMSLLIGIGICFSSMAATIDVGGTKIEIPEPDNFTLVVPEMSELFEFQKKFVAPTNISYASFIPDKEVGVALNNEMPDLVKRFTVQTGKKMVGWSVNKSEFKELSQIIKTQNDEILRKVKEELKEPLEKIGKSFEDELGINANLTVNQMTPLEVHFENERAFSYSAFAKYNFVNEDGSPGTFVAVYTTTFLHIKGKVLFLYTYGNEKDLEWTREVSINWVKEIIKANPNNIKTSIKENTPSYISRIEWWKVGLATAVFGLYGWFKSSKKTPPNDNN